MREWQRGLSFYFPLIFHLSVSFQFSYLLLCSRLGHRSKTIFMENIAEPTIQELLLVLKHRARENAVFSYDAYADLVDEVVNERLGYGEFDTNEDIESLKDELLQRWPEVERYIERNEIEEIG